MGKGCIFFRRRKLECRFKSRRGIFQFFFLSSFFYLSAFYCLFSLLILLASRDFCFICGFFGTRVTAAVVATVAALVAAAAVAGNFVQNKGIHLASFLALQFTSLQLNSGYNMREGGRMCARENILGIKTKMKSYKISSYFFCWSWPRGTDCPTSNQHW